MTIKQSKIVVLVHGLGGSRLDMKPMAKRLARLGFGVINWGYWSLGTRIETHSNRLAENLLALEKADSVKQIHLVGHSMGGIIIRAVLAQEQFRNRQSKLGRMVMLATPNRGSHMAKRLAPWLSWVAPSLKQLSDANESDVNRLPNSPLEVGLEFGVVEATKDRVIHPDCVQLDGQAGFARVVGHHGILTWYPETIGLVERFLTSGNFSISRQTGTSALPAASNCARAGITRRSRFPLANVRPSGRWQPNTVC